MVLIMVKMIMMMTMTVIENKHDGHYIDDYDCRDQYDHHYYDHYYDNKTP